MEKLRLKSECLSCIVKMQLDKVPESCTEEMKMIYQQRVFKLLSEAKATESAPILIKRIADIQIELFGKSTDYTEIKSFYNDYVMKFLPLIEEEIARAEDPLLRAIQYSLTGNYIDFGAMKTVDQEKFEQLLADAPQIVLSETEFRILKEDVIRAERLVILTDNCGEIVFDMALIRLIRKMCPELQITVVIRGEPVLNDATYEDAEQIGLTQEQGVQVIGNGSNVAGTCMEMISDAARIAITSADVLIAKGQGNFETLQDCGLNVYYLFMCKCEMFAKRFQVERYKGLLLNDKRLR